MKILRPLVIAAVVAAFPPASSVFAQASVATYGKEAMESLGHMLDKGAKDGFTMEARTTTIFGCWMPKGNKTGNEPWIGVLTLTKASPEQDVSDRRGRRQRHASTWTCACSIRRERWSSRTT